MRNDAKLGFSVIRLGVCYEGSSLRASLVFLHKLATNKSFMSQTATKEVSIDKFYEIWPLNTL